MRQVLRIGASALALIAATPVAAQTVITPDTAPPATTGTTAVGAGPVTTIDGGQRVGNNLFHSFAAFSLGTGDTALWVRSAGDGASIANIINRITGGAVSTIDGRLATAGMDGANFFFINPAGIVFGTNAEIAVPNVAHFSTAANLRFADGGVFGVTTPGGSVLSMAAPSAFGFLGSQGNITVNQVGQNFAGRDTALALTAANIAINRAEFTPGGLALGAFGNTSRTVSLTDPLASRSTAGTIDINNSFISVQPNAQRDGLVLVNAGRMALTDTILASDSNDRTAAGMRVLVGDLVLRGTASGNQQTYLGSFAPDAGNAAAVDIDALRITMSDASQISSQALPGATGNAGDITIRTGSLTLGSGASIISSAYGSSQSGNIGITANSIAVTSGALIESTTYGSGNGGDLLIETDSLLVDNARIAAEAEATASGDAGTISVLANTVRLDNGGRISSSNLGSGYGGYLGVSARTITLTNGSRIEADSIGGASSGGGQVAINANLVRVESGSEISTVTEGSGQGGTLLISADELILDNGGLNSAALGGSGAAGIIVLQTPKLTMRNGSEITTSTAGSGLGGFIQISTRQLDMSGGSEITSETFASGRAGDIVIDASGDVAPDINIVGNSRIGSSQVGAGASGDAGTISITANKIYLGPATSSVISTNVENSGFAGFIDITAKSIVLDGAEIASAATGLLAGTAGAIDITADTLSIINGGRIESTSFSPDPAGAISITAGTLIAQGLNSEITSENLSQRGGIAGDILIEAGRIEVLDGAAISTNSVAGPAGNITLTMPRDGILVLRGARDSGVITTSSGPGTGGLITIASPYLILSDGGQILALGEASGADVLIQSDFYIRSADRLNLLSVNGSLLLDSQVGDLSTGAEQVDLSFLDASSVLRGQCAASRRGGTNQLNLRATGPYTSLSLPPAGERTTVAARGQSGWSRCAR